MEVRYFKNYSHCLGRDMEFKVYGHAGKPVLFIPCQAGRFFDFENFKMTDTWGPWIEAGKVTVYSVDTLDSETYANFGGDCRWRAEQHERWFNYLVEEMVPTIRHLSGERNGFDQKIATFGCSLGAMHAAILYFRRPDLFDATLCLSGVYEPNAYFGEYCDDILYQNAPVYFLANMPADHPYIDMYNQGKMIFCVGQGAWEDELKASTHRLDDIMRSKGINAWVSFWGEDVSHDWDWWYIQCNYFIPYLLGER